MAFGNIGHVDSEISLEMLNMDLINEDDFYMWQAVCEYIIITIPSIWTHFDSSSQNWISI